MTQRPQMCELQIHRWSMATDTGPCHRVERCLECGDERTAGVIHQWGAPEPGPGAVAALITCGRCSEQKPATAFGGGPWIAPSQATRSEADCSKLQATGYHDWHHGFCRACGYQDIGDNEA